MSFARTQPRHGISALVLLGASLAPCAACGAEGGVARAAALQAEIEEIARSAGGRVGVAVEHIESGRHIELNGDARFPMASAFKLPLAVQFLARVERGEVSFDKVVTLKPSDLREGSSKLAKAYSESRATFTLRQLFERMLIDSDNTATDVIWKEAGGREAVAERLAALGIHGISVDRPTAELVAAAWGITPPPENEWTLARIEELMRARPPGARKAAAVAFFKDGRDTARPDAMVELLIKIWRGEAAGPASTAYLLDVMQRCATGKARLKGMLPSAAKVAHKTGSLTIGVTNDVGIVQLPDGAGTLAIAVMIRESRQPLKVQEHAIAAIAWVAYQHFVPR